MGEHPAVPDGMGQCEKCGIIGDISNFMKPSKRFCSTTCCKSYSAEKRYYPYGKDAKGVARSIKEGLLSTSRAALLAKRVSLFVQQMVYLTNGSTVYYSETLLIEPTMGP